MKWFLVALLCSASLCAAEEIRVLTFNIRMNTWRDLYDRWSNRRVAAAKLINENCDIAGLQEVKPEQRAWLREHLPEFEIIGIGRGRDDSDESVPVVYRKDRFEVLESGTFWLSDTPDVPASRSFGNQLPRVCTWAKLKDRKSGGAIWFYNAHLDHMSAPAREKGLLMVVKRMEGRKADEPAILVGDFNSTYSDAPMKAVGKETAIHLVSTYEALGMPAAGTFHGFTGKAGARAIDYILVDKESWEVKSCEIMKTTYDGADGKARFVSDHFPVKAVLSPK